MRNFWWSDIFSYCLNLLKWYNLHLFEIVSSTQKLLMNCNHNKHCHYICSYGWNTIFLTLSYIKKMYICWERMQSSVLGFDWAIKFCSKFYQNSSQWDGSTLSKNFTHGFYTPFLLNHSLLIIYLYKTYLHTMNFTYFVSLLSFTKYKLHAWRN